MPLASYYVGPLLYFVFHLEVILLLLVIVKGCSEIRARRLIVLLCGYLSWNSGALIVL